MKTIKSAITYFLLGALPLACTVALIYCGKAVHAASIVLDALFIVNFFVYVAVSTVATIRAIQHALTANTKSILAKLFWFALGAVISLSITSGFQ